MIFLMVNQIRSVALRLQSSLWSQVLLNSSFAVTASYEVYEMQQVISNVPEQA